MTAPIGTPRTAKTRAARGRDVRRGLSWVAWVMLRPGSFGGYDRLTAAGRHKQADLFPARRRPVDDRNDLAPEHDCDPIRQLEDFVQLGRNEQDRGARVALLDRLAMNELDAA